MRSSDSHSLVCFVAVFGCSRRRRCVGHLGDMQCCNSSGLTVSGSRCRRWCCGCERNSCLAWLFPLGLFSPFHGDFLRIGTCAKPFPRRLGGVDHLARLERTDEGNLQLSQRQREGGCLDGCLSRFLQTGGRLRQLAVALAGDGERQALRDALVEAAEGSQTVQGHVGAGLLGGGGLDQLQGSLAALGAGLLGGLHGLQGEHLAVHGDGVWGWRRRRR